MKAFNSTFVHSAGRSAAADDEQLRRAREELSAIRRRADDEAIRDLWRTEAYYAWLPEYRRAPIVAKTLRRDREKEDRELRELARRLRPGVRRRLFNETLDPHLN
jgi:hypothetical protein